MDGSQPSHHLSSSEDWREAQSEALSSGAHCHEIHVGEWTSFCRWFTANFGGLELTAETFEGLVRTTEAINLPLEFIETRVLGDGIRAITIAIRAGSRLHRLNITDAHHLRMYCNAAGWPTELEIVSGNKNVFLRFSGGIKSSPQLGTICWGE